ncbi:unnamed protein product [Arctia plantaginis]|uniref:Uncharacterized protein n=1 Tax=Arctia plantaginis TaxID=874455 RepID=A0A8S1A6E2_ARCPL|nr:unnamed protein product [Arctia plantaginis]
MALEHSKKSSSTIHIPVSEKDKLWSPPERKGAIKRNNRPAANRSASDIDAVLGPAANRSASDIDAVPQYTAGPSTASVPYHIPNVELNISDNKTYGEAVSNILSKAQSTDMLQFDKAVQVNCKVPYRIKVSM